MSELFELLKITERVSNQAFWNDTLRQLHSAWGFHVAFVKADIVPPSVKVGTLETLSPIDESRSELWTSSFRNGSRRQA